MPPKSAQASGLVEDVDLDTHQVTDEEINAESGPEFLWAKFAPENAPGLAAVVLQSARPRQPVRLTTGVVQQVVAEVLARVPTTASAYQSPEGPSGPFHDDAIVDQRTAPMTRDLYLRLARARAFPSRKIGKRICARWGDVKASFVDHDMQPKPSVAKTRPSEQDDGLDDLRHEIGLVKKGK
jgi:hypothetical protein